MSSLYCLVLLVVWCLLSNSFVSAETFHERTVANNVQHDASWIDAKASDVVDMVFVLDESGSVGSQNFLKCKEFVKNFLDYFSVAPGHAQVGLVKFGSAATPSISLSHNNDKCTFMSQLDGVAYGNGPSTNAFDGLQKAQIMLRQFGRKALNPRVLQVIVFLTDGDYNTGGDPTGIINSIKSEGVLVIVMMVGRLSRSAQMSSWSSLDNRNVSMAFQLDTFSKFAAMAYYLHEGQQESKYLLVGPEKCQNRCSQPSQCKCDTLGNSGKFTCACEAGFYRVTSGSTSTCKQCPIGQYQHEINVYGTCKSCPTHQTTLGPGAMAASDCKCQTGFWNAQDPNNRRSPPCTTVTCGRDSDFSLAQHNVEISGKCSFLYGQGCDFMCLAGFVTSGVTKRTCGAQGNMDPPLPQCHPLQCPIPPSTTHSDGWTCQYNGQQISNSYPFRTQCQNRCKPGYRKRAGTAQFIMCGQDASGKQAVWSGKALACEPMPCTALPPVPNAVYNFGKCSDPAGLRTFGDECVLGCNPGFIPSQDVSWTCQADGSWTNADKLVYCKDIENPKIINCPNHVTVNNNEGQGSTEVKVVPPEARDNHNTDDLETVLSLQMPGLKEMTYVCNKTSCGAGNFRFPIGDSDAKFTVTDRSGNSAFCSFVVTVKDIEPPTVLRCSGPKTDANDFIYSDQEEVYVDWATPQFADNAGADKLTVTADGKPGMFVTGRAYTVTYTAYDQAKLTATCQFTFKLRGIKCPDLHVPHNGALVCDKLSFGVYCLPQCMTGLERLVPDGMGYTPREYVCTNKGEWIPHDKVGDCSIRKDVQDVGGFSLTFDGNCNDKAVQKTIIQNTIDALKNGATGILGIGFHDSHNRPLTTDDFHVQCGPRNESIIQIGGGGVTRYRRDTLLASAILGADNY